ncbi:MAG: SDR family NAD(P)-dependent oxidoreductase [Bacteroidota bacterium]
MKKNAVVTGGTKGIGKEICRQLAAKDYNILFLGRDEEAGKAVQAEFSQQFPTVDITYQQADFGTIAKTKAAIPPIQAHFPELDLLVNNAGMWTTKLSLNEDGFEQSFVVNHFAPLIISHGLRPQLRAKSPSRIVTVNSGLYMRGQYDPEKTPWGKDFHRIHTYSNSKLCNTMVNIEMAEKLKEENITLNGLHPGVINTGLGDMAGIMGWLLNLIKKRWGTPEEGAEAPVWVSTAEELEGVTGKFFNLKEEMAYTDNATNPAVRKELFEKSMEWTGLSW